MAVHQGKSKARSSQHPAVSHTKKPRHKIKQAPLARLEPRWRGSHLFRFKDAVGKTVEFVEMGASAEFPCIEIGFTDKTALHFLIETRLAMEPTYSDWTTGNMRLLRQWPVHETS